MTELYRPSNGSEGKDSESKPCRIIGRTMALDTRDKGYPREWITDDDGPRCTAFADHEKPRPTLIRDKRQIGMEL